MIRYVNAYADGECGYGYETRQAADDTARMMENAGYARRIYLIRVTLKAHRSEVWS